MLLIAVASPLERTFRNVCSDPSARAKTRCSVAAAGLAVLQDARCPCAWQRMKRMKTVTGIYGNTSFKKMGIIWEYFCFLIFKWEYQWLIIWWIMVHKDIYIYINMHTGKQLKAWGNNNGNSSTRGKMGMWTGIFISLCLLQGFDKVMPKSLLSLSPLVNATSRSHA